MDHWASKIDWLVNGPYRLPLRLDLLTRLLVVATVLGFIAVLNTAFAMAVCAAAIVFAGGPGSGAVILALGLAVAVVWLLTASDSRS